MSPCGHRDGSREIDGCPARVLTGQDGEGGHLDHQDRADNGECEIHFTA